MILDNLYASEISFLIVAESDPGYRVRLGSEYDGFAATATVNTFAEAYERLALAYSSLAVVPWAVGTTLLVGPATGVPTAAVAALMGTMVAVAKAGVTATVVTAAKAVATATRWRLKVRC